MKNKSIIFPNTVKAIFFDLDNTLINRDKAFENYLIYFFCQQNQYRNWLENKEMILEKDNHGFTSRTVFFEFLCQHFVNEKAFVKYQKQYLVADFVEPIANELSQKLKQLSKKYLLGIMTNGGEENQLKKMEKAGIKSLFLEERIFVSEKIGFQKPQIEFFHFVEDKMQLLSTECLLIGDDEKNDIFGGKQANWHTHHSNYEKILTELD